jgi:hypothetical protein
MSNKKCWRVTYLNCANVSGTEYLCATDLEYVPTGGTCGGGYFLSQDLGFNVSNASEKSGTAQQVALSFCGSACTGGQEPGGGTTSTGGTSSANPIVLVGSNADDQSGVTDGIYNRVFAPTPTSPSAGRYLKYTPSAPTYTGQDLKATGDLYLGQVVWMQESFTVVADVTDPRLVQETYLNRAYPYSVGGHWQLRGKTAAPCFTESGQILLALDKDVTSGVFEMRRLYPVYILPKKGDTSGASPSTLNPCNFETYADGTGILAGAAISLPNYKLQGRDPAFTGKNVIPLSDSSKIRAEYYFREVGLYLYPGWAVNIIAHNVEFSNSYIADQNPTQVNLSPACRQGSAV